MEVKTGCSNQIFFFFKSEDFPFGAEGVSLRWAGCFLGLMNNHYSQTALHCSLNIRSLD